MHRIVLASVLALAGVLAVQTSTAQAQWGGGFPGGRHFGLYIGNGGFGYGGGGFGYGGGQYGSYYGNGGHDYQPHWHTTQTPFGQSAWYGNGPHDFVPHEHTHSPWSYQGYSNTQAGPTTSYYNQQPYYFAPW